MEEYKNNSDKNKLNSQSEKKVEPVISGAAKTRKKGEIQKLADVFIAEDAKNVKSYIFTETIIPAIKKLVFDTVINSLEMLMYGEAGRSKQSSTVAKVSYRSYYDSNNSKPRAATDIQSRRGIDYDDILFTTKGDAEIVLDAMNDIIGQYGLVSIADLFDLAHVPNDNFTLNRYGWTNLVNSQVVRVRDGYILKLPRAIPLN